MAQDWIIDVLADLRQYAIRNYHLRLAEHLDDAILAAAEEIRSAAQADDPGLIERDGRGAANVAMLRPMAMQE